MLKKQTTPIRASCKHYLISEFSVQDERERGGVDRIIIVRQGDTKWDLPTTVNSLIYIQSKAKQIKT